MNNFIDVRDLCIDTTHNFIFTFSRSGSRPPLNKYSQAIVFKLDYDLNILDSTIISYSTIYTPIQIALKNNKLYLLGCNANYFSEPVKVNLAVYDLNFNKLNSKVVSDTTQSCAPRKILFDKKNNIRLFLQGNYNGPPPKPLMILDTNLNVLNNVCLLNNCSTVLPSNILKDANGFTYSFDNYFYNQTNYHSLGDKPV